MTHSPDLINAPKDKIFYTLTMFPYPSGSGLHCGHASVFTINDIIARFKRLQWYTVFNPFGFDAFGLPTENYAIKVNKDARTVTDENKAMFFKQIQALNLSFDYDKVIDTSMPDYYKWTQRIFLKLYHAWLVYKKEQRVNWDPIDQTVLANSDVLPDGTAERSGAKVIQKLHSQWFIKITDYADRLIDDLDTVDRPQETKTMQKNWIWRSVGATIDFTVNGEKNTKLTVFTTRPDTLYGVTALVLAPENTVLDEMIQQYWFMPSQWPIRIEHVSKKYPPINTLETKTRNRVTLFVKHPTEDKYLIVYTKASTKLNTLPWWWVDEWETWEQAATRELLEETGYYDIAHIQQIWDEHHWTNVALDGSCNYTSIQRVFLVTLASLDQKPVSKEEQTKHDIFWVDAKQLATTLQDNETVHYGKYYREIYKNTISNVVSLPLASSRDEPIVRPGRVEVKQWYYQQLLDYRQATLLKTAVQRQQDSKEKSGIFSWLYATHPLTWQAIPIWYADYVLPDYGSGAVMLVPAHDTRDWDFAKRHHLPIIQVIKPTFGETTWPENELKEKSSVYAILHDPTTDLYCVFENWSIPWWGIEPGENPLDALTREIAEETGYTDVTVVGDRFFQCTEHYHTWWEKNVHRRNQSTIYLCTLTSHTKAPIANEKGEIETNRPDYQIKRVTAHEMYNLQPHRFRYLMEAYTDKAGVLINSWPFDGLDITTAQETIIAELEKQGIGQKKTTFRLRDWSVSRQRYRGSPIPMLYDTDGSIIPVDENDLPVILPLDLTDIKPKGKSPLEEHPTFKHYHGPKKVPYFAYRDGVYGIRSDMPTKARLRVCVIVYNPVIDKYLCLHYNDTWALTMITWWIDAPDTAIQTVIKEVAEEAGITELTNIVYTGHDTHQYFFNNYPGKESNVYNHTMIFRAETTQTEFGTIDAHELELATPCRMSRDEIAHEIEHTNSTNTNGYPMMKRLLALIDSKPFEWTKRVNAHNDMTQELFAKYSYVEELKQSLHPTSYIRECDTLDTFMCSSFYFLRYPDAHNPDELIRKELREKMFPIDIYSWGKEHTVWHLLYSRFIHKFLYDQGYVSSPEPFVKLVHQGMVLGADGRKMGKRYGNGVDPLEVIDKYGSDAVRTYLMFMGPVDQDKIWSDETLHGTKRYLDRVARIVDQEWFGKHNDQVESAIHTCIQGMTYDMNEMKYNTAVSKLMIATNAIYDANAVSKDSFSAFVIMLSPFAPMLAEQLWKKIWHTDSIDGQSRPLADQSKISSGLIDFPIQINGKMRGTLSVNVAIWQDELLWLIKKSEHFAKYLDGQTIKKIIFVQGKIMNMIVG